MASPALRAALGTVAAALVLAAPAAAQNPVPPPAPAPPPPPAPAPVAGRLSVHVKTPYRLGRAPLALRGGRVRVTGVLAPFVPGQTVTVRVRRGRKVLGKRRLAVAQVGANGAFTTRLRLRRTGRISVQATHLANPALAAAASKRVRLTVARPKVGVGSRGPLVRLLQRGLAKLRYGPSTGGVFDDRTARAVLAWRKVNHRPRIARSDAGMLRAVVAGKGGWKVRHPGAGHHVEAVLSKQALALINGRTVVRVLPTSSGAPATPTVVGSFRFYMKTPGTNAKGMVDSSYFIRGYAIHGYVDVPTYNASHGCLRIPLASASFAYSWIRIGDRMFVKR